MKVGDYVRTKYGISKCIKVIPIRENSFMYEFDREVYEDVMYLTSSELEKYKTTLDIKDLIEVGDYINGERVTDVTNAYIEVCYGRDSTDFIKEQDIKSIVTKEQFEAMEYKVGE